MTKTALSPVIVNAFCELCEWTYISWSAHCALFPDGLTQKDIKSPLAAEGLKRINQISLEHFLHEVCKLHDLAVQNNRVNLGIDYIVRFGGWDTETKAELKNLQADLDNFAAKLRSARNKILSHNDLETILDGATLGKFPPGDDVEYFKLLQKFVNIVHQTVIGGDSTFSTDPSVEASELLKLLRG